MIAGGVGTYRGKAALAVGASHRLQGGNATFKVGVTYDSEEKVGANAGVGFEF
ncbi:MAG: YadA C-terminal domain-containing protein [Sphingomicrobium sp.]